MNSSITDFFPVHKRKYNKIEKSKEKEINAEKEENFEHVDVFQNNFFFNRKSRKQLIKAMIVFL